MCKIIFDPDKHTYTRQSDGLLFMSVSHFTRLWKKPFDRMHHAKKGAAMKVLKGKKYDELKDAWHADKSRNVLMPEFIPYLEAHIKDWPAYEAMIQEVLAGYDEKRDKGAEDGTIHHDWKELASKLRGVELNPVDGIEYPVRVHGRKDDGSNENIVECLADLEWGFHPELMIWHEFPEPAFSESMGQLIAGVCGTEDMVFKNPELIVDTEDYKTSKNKKLDTFGVNYTNYGHEFLKGPWANQWQSDRNIYGIQLNTYAWMLQGHGLTVRDIHIRHKEERIRIPFESDKVAEAMYLVYTQGL